MQQMSKAVLNVIANYVHKTSLNGILVLNESSNIQLPRVKVSEKSLLLTFRNIGVNINWCRPPGKGYQPQPSASTDNPNLDLDYSGYHKNLIQ